MVNVFCLLFVSLGINYTLPQDSLDPVMTRGAVPSCTVWVQLRPLLVAYDLYHLGPALAGTLTHAICLIFQWFFRQTQISGTGALFPPQMPPPAHGGTNARCSAALRLGTQCDAHPKVSRFPRHDASQRGTVGHNLSSVSSTVVAIPCGFAVACCQGHRQSRTDVDLTSHFWG